MSINPSNYESWFLDYHEGNLSAEQVAELFLFLEKHPEFKEEFESFEQILLDEESPLIFEEKDALYKTPGTIISETDDLLIAELECDLSTEQEALLRKKLQEQPQLAAERTLYAQTQLIADTSIVFADKQSLKKKEPARVIAFNTRMWYSAAAGLVLLIGAWYAIQHTAHPSGPAPRMVAEHPAVKTPGVEQRPSVQHSDTTEHTAVTPPTSVQQKQLQQQPLPQQETPVLAEQHKPKKSVRHRATHRKAAQPVLEIQRAVDLAMMLPVTPEPFFVPEPMAYCERRRTPVMENQYAQSTDKKSIGEEGLAMVNNLRERASDEIEKLSTVERADGSKTKLTFKSRVIKSVGNIVNYITNDKVKVKTAFDPLNGELAAYEVEMGKNKWQKQF